MITNGIKSTDYTRAIRADLTRPGLLYAGTEWGMYISFDDGASWQPFQLNLPIVSIRDLEVKDNNLIAATHGRSFWLIDDLTPLHQLNDEIAGKPFHLYAPKDSYRTSQSRRRDEGNELLVGKNHPNGVILQYYLAAFDPEKDEVMMEIMETNGTVIKTFALDAEEKRDKLTAKAGGNNLVWDMRYPGFKEFDGMILYSSPNNGPKAVPGTYKVRLTVNDESVEQEFDIIPDPRLKNTATDYQKQFDFVSAVRDKVSEAHEAIIDIRKTRKDLNYLKEKIAGDESLKDLGEMADQLDEQMSVIENNIHMTKNQSYQDPLNYGIRINNRMAFLMQDQQRGDFPPTDQALGVKEALEAELSKELKDLGTLFDSEIPKINDMIAEKGLKMIQIDRPAVN